MIAKPELLVLFQAVHQHLIVESPSPEVMSIMAEAQTKINTLWREAHLPKFIQFGRDAKGAQNHSLNGPASKAVMRHKSLIVDTIKHMQPVYALLECKKYEPGQTLVKVKVRTEGNTGKKKGTYR